jgi:hypothetical protein
MFPNTPCPTCSPCSGQVNPVAIPDLHNICQNDYNASCIIYTGPDFDCLGILNGMTFQEILSIFAAASTTCKCCQIPDVNCVVSDITWGPCVYSGTEPNIIGTRTGTRTIITPPSGNGTICPPLTVTECCPVNAEWHYEWSSCDPELLKETGTLVVDVNASCGGKPPPTATFIYRDCCVPVNCQLSEWSEWSECDEGGQQTRTRTIITPASCGGTACGPLTETQNCGEPPYCNVPTSVAASIVGPNLVISWDEPTSSTISGFTVSFYSPSLPPITVAPGITSVSIPWVCNTVYDGAVNTNCPSAPESSRLVFWESTLTPLCGCPCENLNFVSGNYKIGSSTNTSITKIDYTTGQFNNTLPVLSGAVSSYNVNGNSSQILTSAFTPNGWLIGGIFSTITDSVGTYTVQNGVGFAKLKCSTNSSTFYSEVDRSVTIKGFEVNAPTAFDQALVRVIKYDAATNRIYVGGRFDKYKGVTCPHNFIALDATTYNIDLSFILTTANIISTNTLYSGVYDIQIDNDGKVLVAGLFDSVLSSTFPVNTTVNAKNLVRFETTGVVDTTFNTANKFSTKNRQNGNYASIVKSILVDSNNDVYAVGSFWQYENVNRNNIVKIKNNGSIATNTDFNPGFGFENAWLFRQAESILWNESPFYNVIVQKIIFHNNKLLVTGNFAAYNKTPVNTLVRLELNGTIDSTFTKDTAPYVNAVPQSSSVPRRAGYDIKVLSNNKILLAGYLKDYLGTGSGVTQGYYVLNSNGTIDTSVTQLSNLNNVEDYVYRISFADACTYL